MLTTAEIDDIKRRVSNNESLNSIGRDYGKFSVWTIRRASKGAYDDNATADDSLPLTDKRIQKLLSWPTPEQAFADHEIQRIGKDISFMFWMSGR